MNIINIDAETFEAMLVKFESFAGRMEALCRLHGDRDMIGWLHNQEVCCLLNISKWTLQTLRDNGTLAYTQISHKTYYKPEDMQKITPVVEEKRKQAKYKVRIDITNIGYITNSNIQSKKIGNMRKSQN